MICRLGARLIKGNRYYERTFIYIQTPSSCMRQSLHFMSSMKNLLNDSSIRTTTILNICTTQKDLKS